MKTFWIYIILLSGILFGGGPALTDLHLPSVSRPVQVSFDGNWLLFSRQYWDSDLTFFISEIGLYSLSDSTYEIILTDSLKQRYDGFGRWYNSGTTNQVFGWYVDGKQIIYEEGYADETYAGGKPYKTDIDTVQYFLWDISSYMGPVAGKPQPRQPGPEENFQLASAPNPFDQGVRMTVSLPWPEGQLSITNVQGQVILKKQIHTYRFDWDGLDNTGQSVPSGHYYAKIENRHGQAVSKKLTKF